MSLDAAGRAAVERALSTRVVEARALGGGCIAAVLRVSLADGRQVVVKRGHGLALEAWMLRWLRAHTTAPVPEVLHADETSLILELLEGDSAGLSSAAEAELGAIAAGLHAMESDGSASSATRSSALCRNPIRQAGAGAPSSATTGFFIWREKRATPGACLRGRVCASTRWRHGSTAGSTTMQNRR